MSETREPYGEVQSASVDLAHAKSEPMTDERLAEIEARANAATSGQWEACGQERGGCECGMIWSRSAGALVMEAIQFHPALNEPARSEAQMKLNALFVAHARADVPDLCAEVKRLREEVARLRATMRRF